MEQEYTITITANGSWTIKDCRGRIEASRANAHKPVETCLQIAAAMNGKGRFNQYCIVADDLAVLKSDVIYEAELFRLAGEN